MSTADTDRRLTKFPGSSTTASPTTPTVQSKKRAFTEDEQAAQRLSASKLPKIPHLPQRQHPPRMFLPVKTDSQQWHQRSRVSGPYPVFPGVNHDKFLHKASPWDDYYAILEEEKGESVLAHSKKERHDIVVIRKTKSPIGDSITGLKRCYHQNLVTLHDVYVDSKCFYFVYEFVDVSLAEIQCTPVGNFASYQIAAVCCEVLQALQYIHEKLKIVHGSVNADTVVVTREGHIKLAQIGVAMLKGKSSGNEAQNDYRALGLLMVKLMEPDTSLANPDTLELQNPDEWDSAIKDFLGKTAKSPGKELRKDDFLLKNPSTNFFKALVLITERSIHRDWQIRMDE